MVYACACIFCSIIHKYSSIAACIAYNHEFVINHLSSNSKGMNELIFECIDCLPTKRLLSDKFTDNEHHELPLTLLYFMDHLTTIVTIKYLIAKYVSSGDRINR